METDAGITRVRSSRLRMVLFAIALGSMLFVNGCGSDATQNSNTAKQYPTGVSEDIDQQLKYDARVDSFEPDGENLIVDVNDAWVNSPQGMQERAMGQWYSLWHAGHSSGKVIVKHNGDAVATWSDKGYKPEKLTTGEGEVHSES
jgi:outer membrane murein-binding lipoprotein Lpp